MGFETVLNDFQPTNQQILIELLRELLIISNN